jgi:hypothetical protein
LFTSFFPPYSDLSLPTHCWNRGLLLHLITLGETHPQTSARNKTPLNEGSVLLRDLYLITHNYHNIQTSMPRCGNRSRNPRKRAATDPRLRPHDQDNFICRLNLYRFVNPLTPELNPSAQRCLTRFLLRILLLELCISLIYA